MFDVNVFVGKVVNPTVGGRIFLPTEKEEIDRMIASLHLGDAEFSIMEVESPLPMGLGGYTDVYQLNEDLHLIKEWFELQEETLLYTAYAFKNENLKDAIALLQNGNYVFFENILNEEDLGEAVLNSGQLGVDTQMLPEHVTRYFDFERIGLDWIGNGCVIYPKFETAMMEVSPE